MITTPPPKMPRLLPILKAADLVPNIVGGSGIGKTQTVGQFRDLVKENIPDYGFVLSIQSMMDPVDNRGVPDLDRDMRLTRWYAPATLPVEGNDELPARGLTFHDELDRCDPANLNTLLTRLSSRVVDNRKIKAGWWDVCAMNGATDEYTTPLPKALKKRLVHIYFYHSDIAGLVQHATGEGWHGDVVSFLAKEKPLPVEPEWEDLAVDVLPNGDVDAPSGRQFEYLSRAEHALAKRWPFQVSDLRPIIVQGILGYVYMLKYMVHCSTVDIPSLDEIVRDPNGCRLPDDAAGLYAVASLIAAGGDPARSSSFAIYLGRLANASEEIAMYGFRAASVRIPTLLASTEYSALHNMTQA